MKSKAAGSKPITGHPLFPAVIALWFGALFGLGNLAIRPALFESLVVRIGIDQIIPAAAPPLGITARILIALTLAAVGAAIGAILARRLARPERREAAAPARPPFGLRAAPEPAARRPISAHDELGDSLDTTTRSDSIAVGLGQGVLPGGRLALAVEDEDEEPLPPAAPISALDTPGIAPAAAALAAPEPAPCATPAISDLAMRLQESMARRRAARHAAINRPAAPPVEPPTVPVVIFPGQVAAGPDLPDRPSAALRAAAIDPETAQTALREALAKLERISGAA